MPLISARAPIYYPGQSTNPLLPETNPHPKQSRRLAIVLTQVALLLVALVVYALRVYTRQRIVHALGLDDLLLGIAVIFTVILSVDVCVGTKFGWGLHDIDIGHHDKHHAAFVAYLAEILYTTTVSVIKVSVLTFYLRIATPKTYRRIIFGTMGFVGAWMITFIFVLVFQCKPIDSYWDVHVDPQWKCLNADIVMGVHGITNIFTDLFVFFLPMPMLWGVQLPRRQRISLIALFGLGSLVCVGCAMRLHYSYAVKNDHQDGIWNGLYLFIWESVEIDLGIACASLPALKPLITAKWPKFFSSSINSGKESSNPSSGVMRRGQNWGNHSAKGPAGSSKLATESNEGSTGEGEAIYQLSPLQSVSIVSARPSIEGGMGAAGGWKKMVPLKGSSESEESLTQQQKGEGLVKGIVVSTEIQCECRQGEEPNAEGEERAKYRRGS